MTTAQSKALAWSLAGLLGVCLSAYIAWFVTQLEDIKQGVSVEDMEVVLDDPGGIIEKAYHLVPYETVKTGFHNLNWTGKAVIVVEQDPQDLAQEPKPSERPVSELVQVIYLQIDPRQPEGSTIIVRYLPSSGVTLRNSYEGLMRVGDTLRAPHQHVRLAAVGMEGASFGFDDEAREHELLLPQEMEIGTMISAVGEGQAWRPRREQRIGVVASPGRPPQTQVYQNRVLIGVDDYQHLAQDYSEILSNDVRTVRHRDPRTGRYDGIEVREIRAGSVASRQGVESGDVIKSINGHPVSSVSEAVSYVKNNSGMHSGAWEVVVENLGRSRTLYIDPPTQP